MKTFGGKKDTAIYITRHSYTKPKITDRLFLILWLEKTLNARCSLSPCTMQTII